MDTLPDNAAHILVVDDDQRIRDLLARYLFEQGFRVTTATDAASARAAMRVESKIRQKRMASRFIADATSESACSTARRGSSTKVP